MSESRRGDERGFDDLGLEDPSRLLDGGELEILLGTEVGVDAALASIEAIADSAGVSAQTVYNQFGTKCELLAAVLDLAIAGDAAPLAVMERPWFLVDEAEPAPDAIARFAAAGTAILARVAPMYDVIRSASSLPEVRRLLDDNRSRRRADQRRLVSELAAAG